MKLSHVLLLTAALLAACNSKPRTEPKDPNAPAVEPAVVNMPSEAQRTAGIVPAAPKATLIPADPSQRNMVVSQGYGLAGAMMINQDTRMLSGLYASDALLALPDTTVQGTVPIVQRLTALAKSKSLADFQRSSQGSRIVDDSTLADSGTYVMILKRTPRDSVFERGHYATTWRARAGGTDKWVMTSDRIAPDVKPAGKK
jgi:hypothetical protein